MIIISYKACKVLACNIMRYIGIVRKIIEAKVEYDLPRGLLLRYKSIALSKRPRSLLQAQGLSKNCGKNKVNWVNKPLKVLLKHHEDCDLKKYFFLA